MQLAMMENDMRGLLPPGTFPPKTPGPASASGGGLAYFAAELAAMRSPGP